MAKKLVLALVTAAAVVVSFGCKDSGPTSMNFDPSKANYSSQKGGYTKGATSASAATTSTP